MTKTASPRSALKGLRFHDIDRPKVDPLSKARSKFGADLLRQREIAEGVDHGTARSWVFLHAGSYYFQLRFGNRPLPYVDGSVVELKNPDELPRVIKKLLIALDDGEFDECLSAAIELNRRAVVRTKRAR